MYTSALYSNVLMKHNPIQAYGVDVAVTQELALADKMKSLALFN